MASTSSSAAVAAAKLFEGNGRVINEWYTRDEYTTRRLGFLGAHPEHRRIPRLLPGIRDAAVELFSGETGALSAQRVRARELECKIEPLLPLSTTTNTETLDSHQGYPASEWTAGFVPAIIVREETPLQDQMAINIPTPGHMQHLINALGQPLGTVPALTPRYNSNHGVSSVSNRPIHVPVKTPQSVKRAAPDGDDEIDSVCTDSAIEASPAPPPRKRSKTAPDESDADTAPPPRKRSKTAPDESNSDIAPPPRKRSKIAHDESDSDTAPPPARTSPKLTLKAPSKKPAASAKTKATKGKRRARQTSVAADATTNATATRKRQDSYADIVNGLKLPRSREEAKAAAVVRRQMLTEEYLAMHPNARHPDLPPEFHDTRNFTKQERKNLGVGDDGPVRCVCGNNNSRAPPGFEDWVGCDNTDCGVWQHVRCIGAAVPNDEKEREAADYVCQVCDPYVHRKLIQSIRKLHQL